MFVCGYPEGVQLSQLLDVLLVTAGVLEGVEDLACTARGIEDEDEEEEEEEKLVT